MGQEISNKILSPLLFEGDNDVDILESKRLEKLIKIPYISDELKKELYLEEKLNIKSEDIFSFYNKNTKMELMFTIGRGSLQKHEKFYLNNIVTFNEIKGKPTLAEISDVNGDFHDYDGIKEIVPFLETPVAKDNPRDEYGIYKFENHNSKWTRRYYGKKVKIQNYYKKSTPSGKLHKYNQFICHLSKDDVVGILDELGSEYETINEIALYICISFDATNIPRALIHYGQDIDLLDMHKNIYPLYAVSFKDINIKHVPNEGIDFVLENLQASFEIENITNNSKDLEEPENTDTEPEDNHENCGCDGSCNNDENTENKEDTTTDNTDDNPSNEGDTSGDDTNTDTSEDSSDDTNEGDTTNTDPSNEGDDTTADTSEDSSGDINEGDGNDDTSTTDPSNEGDTSGDTTNEGDTNGNT